MEEELKAVKRHFRKPDDVKEKDNEWNMDGFHGTWAGYNVDLAHYIFG